MVLWNYQRWALVLPLVTYLAKFGEPSVYYHSFILFTNLSFPFKSVAVSIPLLISQVKSHDAKWVSRYSTYATIYYSITVAFNVVVTAMICIRLHLMRRKVEAAIGRLAALLYTSPSTKFVESGAFYTVWSIIYLILRTQASPVKDVFLHPSSCILVRIQLECPADGELI